jgi:hypothetical protein
MDQKTAPPSPLPLSGRSFVWVELDNAAQQLVGDSHIGAILSGYGRNESFLLGRESPTIHPAPGPDLRQPILGCRYASQILFHVLFTDVPHRNLFAIAVRNRDAKDLFTQENTFRVMSKSSVSEIRDEGFRCVEPVMNGYVVLSLATEFAGAALSVLEWMCHG